MAISVKHKFTSAKTDGVDSTRIQPSNWNDEHDLELATAKLLGRTTAGAGPAEEIGVSADLSLAALTLGLSFPVTPFIKTLLDDANAAAARLTLGLNTDAVDINGGTVDGTVIGGAAPAAGTFTTVAATSNVSVSAADPRILMTDTGGGSDVAYSRSYFERSPGTFSLNTARGDNGAFISTDIEVTVGASGATAYSFRHQGSERLRVANSPAVTVTGSLSASGSGTFTGGLNTNAIFTLTGNPNIGDASLGRFGTIFLVNAPNVSSDARLKDEVRDLNGAERRAAAKIKTRTFIMRDGGQRKIGYIAQEIIEAMASEGLDAFEYGLVSDGETYGVDMDAVNAFRLG
jgi:hypothetical protein